MAMKLSKKQAIENLKFYLGILENPSYDNPNYLEIKETIIDAMKLELTTIKFLIQSENENGK